MDKNIDALLLEHRFIAWWFGLIHKISPKIYNLIVRKFTVIKYLISGGSSAFVQLALLYILTDIFKIWYLFSAVIAFIVAFFMSFLLHKFWTFLDNDMDVMHKQLFSYFVLAMINLGLNTLLMYFFVDVVHIWYFGAQFITSGLIAFSSFYLYKKIIFKSQKSSQ